MTRDEKTSAAPLLRSGFSTGAYAAATALTAWRHLKGEPLQEKLLLWFADDRMRPINVNGVVLHKNGIAEAWAVKDGGDDIDATDKSVIHARVCRFDKSSAFSEDFVESCGAATLIIRGAEGVGLVRRSGLDVPVGKWAINPIPRTMIVENLRRNGAGDNPTHFID